MMENKKKQGISHLNILTRVTITYLHGVRDGNKPSQVFTCVEFSLGWFVLLIPSSKHKLT